MISYTGGKKYLTNKDNADVICDYWNGLPDSDPNNMSETLYITKKGNYYLYGTGGALTKYSESGGEKITPLTKKQALEYCEEHCSNDVIEQHFSDMIEDA